MLKPIKLFGVEQKRNDVFFIHHKGSGFWFMSTGHRVFGEAKSLKELSENAQKMELSRNWIILDIVRDNREALLEEFLQENSEGLTAQDIEGLKESEVNNKLGIFTRELIRSTDLFHPILWKYKEQVSESLFTTDLTFEYQEKIITSAFIYRYINDPNFITVDPDDPEKGVIELQDSVSKNFIGYQFPVDLQELGEPLCLRIYDFCQREYAGEPWYTTKMLEKQATEIEKDFDETISASKKELEEKKPNPQLTPSNV